jgi:hypothetical protein
LRISRHDDVGEAGSPTVGENVESAVVGQHSTAELFTVSRGQTRTAHSSAGRLRLGQSIAAFKTHDVTRGKPGRSTRPVHHNSV